MVMEDLYEEDNSPGETSSGSEWMMFGIPLFNGFLEIFHPEIRRIPFHPDALESDRLRRSQKNFTKKMTIWKPDNFKATKQAIENQVKQLTLFANQLPADVDPWEGVDYPIDENFQGLTIDEEGQVAELEEGELKQKFTTACCARLLYSAHRVPNNLRIIRYVEADAATYAAHMAILDNPDYDAEYDAIYPLPPTRAEEYSDGNDDSGDSPAKPRSSFFDETDDEDNQPPPPPPSNKRKSAGKRKSTRKKKARTG